MNNLQYLRTNYLRNIVILQRNQYVSRISSDWELCGMCVFPSISSFVLENSKLGTIAAQGIQGFENVRFKNFQSEGKRTKRTFENCTKVLFVNIAEICVSRDTFGSSCSLSVGKSGAGGWVLAQDVVLTGSILTAAYTEIFCAIRA